METELFENADVTAVVPRSWRTDARSLYRFFLARFSKPRDSRSIFRFALVYTSGIPGDNWAKPLKATFNAMPRICIKRLQQAFYVKYRRMIWTRGASRSCAWWDNFTGQVSIKNLQAISTVFGDVRMLLCRLPMEVQFYFADTCGRTWTMCGLGHKRQKNASSNLSGNLCARGVTSSLGLHRTADHSLLSVYVGVPYKQVATLNRYAKLIYRVTYRLIITITENIAAPLQ